MKRFRTVDEFIAGQAMWRDELTRLREILLATALEETVKWGAPCYVANGTNVVGLGAFKSYFGLWFFQGALLEDARGVLINAQEGTTKALRQWRMTSAHDIRPRIITGYVREAIALAESGRQIGPERRTGAVQLAPELSKALKADRKARAAFGRLTPGRQREYSQFIDAAKREETRRRRLEKCLPLIAAGKGLNDKYRNC